jgi:hypothetical protein
VQEVGQTNVGAVDAAVPEQLAHVTVDSGTLLTPLHGNGSDLLSASVIGVTNRHQIEELWVLLLEETVATDMQPRDAAATDQSQPESLCHAVIALLVSFFFRTAPRSD